MSTDAVAITGFLSLFGLMMLRVPVGIAMGLVGVLGFGYLIGDIGPALKLLSQSPIRTATDAEFAVIPLFLLMGAFASASGMSKELFRASNTFLGHLQGRPRHRHHRRLRRLRRDLRFVSRHRRHLLQGRLSGNARARLSAKLFDRRDRGRRLARHHDPALDRIRGLWPDYRAGHRQIVHRRRGARHPGGVHVHRHHQHHRLDQARLSAGDPASQLGRTPRSPARRLGGVAAVHLHYRRHLRRRLHRHRSRRHGRRRRLHHRGAAAETVARRLPALPGRIFAHDRVGVHHPDRRADFRLLPHHHADAAEGHASSSPAWGSAPTVS